VLYILKQTYRVYSKKSIIFLKILIFKDVLFQLMDKVVIIVHFVVNIGENVVINNEIVVIPV